MKRFNRYPIDERSIDSVHWAAEPGYREPARRSIDSRVEDLEAQIDTLEVRVQMLRRLARKRRAAQWVDMILAAALAAMVAYAYVYLLRSALVHAQPPALRDRSRVVNDPHRPGDSRPILERAPLERDASPPHRPLERALLARLRLPAGPFVAHCRRARGGCEAYVGRIALTLHHCATDVDLDPYLLAAIAYHESGLYDGAIGASGEHGLMQLHPRSRWGQEAARQCRVAPSDCDAIEIEIAARLLATSIARCGSESSALVAYNTGRCDSASGQRYARAVLRIRDELRSAS